jgi:hypothetical protein
MIELLIPCGFDTLEDSWVKATIGICMLVDYSVAKKCQHQCEAGLRQWTDRWPVSARGHFGWRAPMEIPICQLKRSPSEGRSSRGEWGGGVTVGGYKTPISCANMSSKCMK